jgi:hypothetical protein
MPRRKTQSSRQMRKENLRRMYGNPWDSTSSKSSSNSSKSITPSKQNFTKKAITGRKAKKSAIKSQTANSNRISFREPLERSRSSTKSTTSSRHSAWKNISSK